MTEYSAMIGDQLTQLLGNIANKYRPRRFRSMLNVVQEIPVWATQGTYTKVKVASHMKLSSQYDTSVPLASHQRDSRSFGVAEFSNGYRIAREEVLRASQDPGYSLDPVLGVANQRLAEATLQELLLLGTFEGAAINSSINGLLNMPDMIDQTSNLTNSETWVDASGNVVQTDADVILGVFDEMFSMYSDEAGEDVSPDRCMIPKWQSKALLRRSALLAGGERIIDLLRSEYPGTIFEFFTECNGAGGAGVDRLVLYSSDEDVNKAIVPEEYHDLTPVDEPLESIVVPSIMKAGGCISNFPQGIQRFDLTRSNTP